jgi:hypothetical protein
MIEVVARTSDKQGERKELSTMTRPRIFLGLLCSMLFLTGSSGAAQNPTATIPDSPLGQQLLWAIETINSGAKSLSVDEVEQRFGTWFLNGTPPENLIENLQLISEANAPLTITEFLGTESDPYSIAKVAGRDGSELAITIAIEPELPHKIALLLVQPVPPGGPIQPPAQQSHNFESWKDFDDYWTSRGEKASFLAAELTGDGCKEVHSNNPDEVLAIGSLAELYVLGTLVQHIYNGASWSDELEIHEEWKARPPGTMQDEPAGSRFTLEEYARRMILDDDSTAMDYLIQFLGREQVEAVQSTMGHDNPALNTPFLTNREFIALKASAPENLRSTYINSAPDQRRQLLESEVPAIVVDDMDVAMLTVPNDVDGTGWLASVSELCDAMLFLHEQSQKPGMEPLGGILLDDNGPMIGSPPWIHGGIFGEDDDPGVTGSVWLVQNEDGRWFVLAGVVNDTKQSVQSHPLDLAMIPVLMMLD